MLDTAGLTREIQKAVEFKNWYPFGHEPPPGTPAGLWNPWVVHVDTLFWTWVAMGVLILLALYLKPRLTLVPEKFSVQNVLEWIWDFFYGIAHDMMGGEAFHYMPVVMTIFFFVLLGNLFGLIPALIPYTRDANTTVGLALYSFMAFTYYGIAKKGFLKWVFHFTEPVPALHRTLEGPLKYIMIPPLFLLFVILNFIEETARIISLSMRLFGNIMGKHIVMAVLLGLTVFLLKIFDVLPIFVWLIGLIASIVQAMIFALLTLAYISGAVGEHH
jgi:F-type H+-transporting ATPase subunit a